ncbi:G2/mitotic-specific cyclin-B [Anthophora plagiata]
MENTSEKKDIQNDNEREKNSQRNNLDDKVYGETDVDVLCATRFNPTNQEDIEKRIQSLRHVLENDIKAADLKWSLFVAACNTYRYDTCLKPFPPMYIKKECKDIEALRRATEVIPPLAVISKALSEPDVYERYGTAINLLHWVLVRLRDPYLKSIKKECYDSILRKVPSEMSVVAPNLIFQVASTKQSTSEDRWKTLAQGHTTFYAYHGSRLENFHSIIHYGLQQNMCKKSLFGKGIYLTSELGVSLPYSPVGYGWGGSVLGSDMSCIALCELINSADVKTGGSEDNARHQTADSVGGRVPNKYYLVTNSELVRIRYLLVYSQQVQTTRCTDNKGLLAWFKQHKLLTFNIVNQENVKNIKSSMNVVAGKTKRAALGEIGNKVNTIRGVESIDRPSLLLKDKKKVIAQKQAIKPPEKVTEKPPIQIVKPVIKFTVPHGNHEVPTIPKKEVESFSSDLLAVEDIDEEDKGNPSLVSIYSNDIYEYLRTLESKFPIVEGYLGGQEVTPKMRSVLIDWLVEVHQQFHLMQETLYLTVAIIDRFLQTFHSIDRKRLQLVGVTAMFIASKYEEMYSPDINDFVYITDNAYSKVEILQMEMLIVKTLDYSFGRPLPLHFLRRYSKAGKALPIHHTMAKYFLEQSLVYYEMCHYPPSLIAAAAIYLAFVIIGNDDEDEQKFVWTNTLAHYSTYTKDDVLPVVREAAKIIVNADKSKYQAVRKKYVQAKYMKISTRPELRSPTLIAIATANKKTV